MINNLGLYVQQDLDCGDASHRTGSAVAILGLLGRKDQAQELLAKIVRHMEVDMSGIYIRHPGGYLPTWTDNPKAFSRDQASRIILAYAVMGYKSGIHRWLKTMKVRGFRHQNDIDPTTNEKKFADIMGPGEFRNLIRGLNLWYLYPTLILLDFLFLGDIYLRSKWDGGSLYVPDIFYACKKYPTPFAFLAKYITKKDNSLNEILHNHSPEKNGCVELQDLFKELYKG